MIKKIFARLKLDWDEFWYYKNKERTNRRTERSIQSEVDHALMLNAKTGKTYYIFINANHVPQAMDNHTIKAKRRHGEFPRDWKHNKILEHALIIVQSQNEIARHQTVSNIESVMKKEE